MQSDAASKVASCAAARGLSKRWDEWNSEDEAIVMHFVCMLASAATSSVAAVTANSERSCENSVVDEMPKRCDAWSSEDEATVMRPVCMSASAATSCVAAVSANNERSCKDSVTDGMPKEVPLPVAGRECSGSTETQFFFKLVGGRGIFSACL